MRFILPILVTVVFLSSCTSKEEESATPTSPLTGNWRQISLTMDDATLTLPEDYGLTLRCTADSLIYSKHDTLISAMKYKVSVINNSNVITSSTVGYEDYFVAYKLNTAGDTLNLYVPSFATSGENNSALYVKIK